MAPRKSKISGAKKTKIKSKRTRLSKRKPSKRKYKTVVPLKKRKFKKINLRDYFNDSEVKINILDDVYKKTFQNRTDSFTDFPLEELYHDPGTYSSSDEDRCELSESMQPTASSPSHRPPESSKRKIASSEESLVEEYIESGMNHVPSFIVGSALRYGREQGTVIPERGNTNIYQFVPPYPVDKNNALRFRIPSKIFGYEDAKKAMWKRRKPLHSAKSTRLKVQGPGEPRSGKKKKNKVKPRRRKIKEITEPKSPRTISTTSSSSIIT